MSKLNYWDPVYEDSMNLIAQLPGVAALIYRNTYKGGQLIPRDPKLDWAANLSHQMGAQPRLRAWGCAAGAHTGLLCWSFCVALAANLVHLL